MSGEKGKRKRSSAQERRGGKELAVVPKIRKIAQVDMGKREGKLQVKGKMRRLGEKAEEVAAVAAPTPMYEEETAAADDPARRMALEKIALYEAVMKKDCDDGMVFPEHAAPPPLFPSGMVPSYAALDQGKADAAAQ